MWTECLLFGESKSIESSSVCRYMERSLYWCFEVFRPKGQNTSFQCPNLNKWKIKKKSWKLRPNNVYIYTYFIHKSRTQRIEEHQESGIWTVLEKACEVYGSEEYTANQAKLLFSPMYLKISICNSSERFLVGCWKNVCLYCIFFLSFVFALARYPYLFACLFIPSYMANFFFCSFLSLLRGVLA